MISRATEHAAYASFAVALIAGAFYLRWQFIRQAASLRVDHHYWLLATEAFRRQRRLPIRFDGRYLLEPSEQAYPPFFAWLLARLPRYALTGSGGIWLCQGADAAALGVGLALGLWLGMGWPGTLMAMAATLFAPTLVAYNTQLNPRSFGNLFLVVKMASEVVAVGSSGPEAWVFWAVAAIAAAGVWLTHKMAMQLMVALWLPWALALASPAAALAPLAGLGLAACIVGPWTLLYQFSAHLDVVRFWSRHWPHLGVHAVHLSPIYGNAAADRAGALHQQGWRGPVQHARLIFGYAPALLLMPLTLGSGGAVPSWLIVWTLGTLAWALLTSLLPALKGLGAGALYVFFGVIPSSIWLGLTAGSGEPVALLAAAAVCTGSAMALALGWRQRQGRRSDIEPGLSELLDRLRRMRAQRLAVLPLNVAETVAAETHHAVLWGGHGYGFDLLEPIFPRITRPLGQTLARYRIERLVWNRSWWPELESVLSRELKLTNIETFEGWCMAAIPNLPNAPRPVVQVLSSDVAQFDRDHADLLRSTAIDIRVFAPALGAGPRSLSRSHGCRGARRLAKLYCELRDLRPDIIDCRYAGLADIFVANLAGVPHRIVREPSTLWERRIVAAGLGRPLSADDDRIIAVYQELHAGDWAHRSA